VSYSIHDVPCLIYSVLSVIFYGRCLRVLHCVHCFKVLPTLTVFCLLCCKMLYFHIKMNKHDDTVHVCESLSVLHSQYGRWWKDIPSQNALELSWSYVFRCQCPYEYVQRFREVRFWFSSLHRAFRKITSTINQQTHLYNFHLKHFKTLKNHSAMFRSFQIIIREFSRSLVKLLHIHDLVRFCKQGVVAAYHVV